jgi:hypothetical protein
MDWLPFEFYMPSLNNFFIQSTLIFQNLTVYLASFDLTAKLRLIKYIQQFLLVIFMQPRTYDKRLHVLYLIFDFQCLLIMLFNLSLTLLKSFSTFIIVSYAFFSIFISDLTIQIFIFSTLTNYWCSALKLNSLYNIFTNSSPYLMLIIFTVQHFSNMMFDFYVFLS